MARGESVGPGLTRGPFTTLADGTALTEYALTSAHGLRVAFIDLGGCITAIEAPDRDGARANVVLGYHDPAEYGTNAAYFGAIVGRYANRIAGGAFSLGGRRYHLPINQGTCSQHGGPKGFTHRMWAVTPGQGAGGPSAVLSYTSPDGENGYPGTLSVTLTYTLEGAHTLRIDYEARTDEPTVVNLTNHSYFNLRGNGSGSALGTLLEIDADAYLPTDADQIPTGEVASVQGTPMDFRRLTPIGARIRRSFPQLLLARGYDHNWVLNKPEPAALTFAARAYEPVSGRIMECATTEPGLQLYTANYFDATVLGSSGTIYRQGDAFTLETQHYPDSPNHPGFPSTTLRPGETLRSTTTFRFSTDA